MKKKIALATLLLIVPALIGAGALIRSEDEGQNIEFQTWKTGDPGITKKGEMKDDGTFVVEKIENAAGSQPTGAVPSGAIMPYGGSSAPTGWLLCDGANASKTTYPNLESAIGETWGEGSDGAGGDSFSLPNLLGRTLKGAGAITDGNGGDSIALGVFQDDATAANGLGNATSTVTGIDGTVDSTGITLTGTRTAGSAGAHVHRQNVTSGGGVTANATWQDTASSIAVDSAFQTDSGGAHPHTVTGGSWALTSTAWSQTGTATAAAQTINGDAETRPKAYGVNYIIKI